ncbi:MAG: acyltransferase family protein [Collinsella sp.]
MQNTPTGAAHAAPQRNQRIVALDGFRALAIAGVVLYHLRPSRLTGGFLGVTLFFTLSGYLATKSIMRATARDGFSYPRYICRRIARMMPPIVVTIAFTAVATYIAAPSLLPKVQQTPCHRHSFEQLVLHLPQRLVFRRRGLLAAHAPVVLRCHYAVLSGMAGHPYGTVRQNQVAQHRHRHHNRIRACIDGSHGPHV